MSCDMSDVLRAMYSPWSPPWVAADLIDAIDALHQPVGFGACSCGNHDCLTARLLHPEEAT
jgi:hypothetical protein